MVTVHYQNEREAWFRINPERQDSSEDKKRCRITTVAAYPAAQAAIVVVMRHFCWSFVLSCPSQDIGARNGDRYSRQCDQNGSTGDQTFSSGRQIGDLFRINDIIKTQDVADCD